MKRTKQCPKCESRRIGHLAEQLDLDDRVMGPLGEHPAGVQGDKPRGRVVGYRAEKVDTGWLNFGELKPVVGALKAYVCANCGYYESYVIEPQNLEWNSLVGFSWVNSDVESGGPFR